MSELILPGSNDAASAPSASLYKRTSFEMYWLGEKVIGLSPAMERLADACNAKYTQSRPCSEGTTLLLKRLNSCLNRFNKNIPIADRKVFLAEVILTMQEIIKIAGFDFTVELVSERPADGTTDGVQEIDPDEDAVSGLSMQAAPSLIN